MVIQVFCLILALMYPYRIHTVHRKGTVCCCGLRQRIALTGSDLTSDDDDERRKDGSLTGMACPCYGAFPTVPRNERYVAFVPVHWKHLLIVLRPHPLHRTRVGCCRPKVYAPRLLKHPLMGHAQYPSQHSAVLASLRPVADDRLDPVARSCSLRRIATTTTVVHCSDMILSLCRPNISSLLYFAWVILPAIGLSTLRVSQWSVSVLAYLMTKCLELPPSQYS